MTQKRNQYETDSTSDPLKSLQNLLKRSASEKPPALARTASSELELPRRSFQFGFQIPYLPDFLLDHTLLEKESHERIAEHCRRWTQFVSGLWREEGVTFALVYQWTPVSTNPADRRTDANQGSIGIFLLGNILRDKVPENVSQDVARALKSFGFEPRGLSTEEINQLKMPSESEVFEVRQRDDRVQVDADFITQYYRNDLPPQMLRTIERGIYTVSPWWGAGGSFLVPFQTLVNQEKPVAVWILLRPVSLNLIAHERSWFMKWTRLLAKWADDSASSGESVTLSEGQQYSENRSTNTGTQTGRTHGTGTNEGKGGERFFWDGTWNSGTSENQSTSVTESAGQSFGTTTGRDQSISVTRESRTFTSKDPHAKWLAEEATAFFRKLNNPFFVTVYCISEDYSAGRVVANSIASTISEETSFEPPPGESEPRRSSAQMIRLDEEQKQRALNACQSLTFDTTLVQNSLHLMDEDLHSLNYIADARSAATVFRFPINVRGGIPGIEVKQQAPDFHPGLIHSAAPPNHISLGSLAGFGIYSTDAKNFKKHALITGFTGSGKTVTVLNLLHQFWVDCRVPFLVIESAKQEYRGLLCVEGFRGVNNLRVYTLGNEVCAPFRFNPFELLPGVRVEAHISKLQTCFEGALPPIGPLASLIYEALHNIYREKGWQLTDSYPRGGERVWRSFPTMSDFAAQVEQLIKVRGYQGEVRDNLVAAITGRIKPLTMGSKGRMFDTHHSHPPAVELFKVPTILELNDLNQDDKALVVMFLLTLLREYREIDPPSSDELKHITVVEEAHNVLENVQSSGSSEGASADTRYKAVQSFCNMLAEIRALGEGLIIADQSPEKLAPDAMRNTNVQIAHQLRDSRDREAIAKAMIMDEEQQDFLGKLETGNAALFETGLQKATFIKIPKFYPTADDRRDGESEQEETARFRRSFRGYGFRAVEDEELKAYMNELTREHRRLDLPFAGCRFCPAQGCHRDSMFVLSRDPALQAQFTDIYPFSDDETRKNTVVNGLKVSKGSYWSTMARIALGAVRCTGDPDEINAAWCFYLHAWQNEIKRRRAENAKPLDAGHRANFETGFSRAKNNEKGRT